MNLQTHIRSELWAAISSTYESGNYSHAILDAIHFMSDLIRDKANVDGDGPVLVGQALGGEIPRLKLSKLQTQTERDMQKGVEQILRGIYQAIRNPRSHEQIVDPQETADAIIYFLNYLLNIIDQSQEPFSIPEFLARVFDPDFVENERYSDLLISEIPPGKKLDILIEIYRRKNEGDGKKLRFIISSLIKNLAEDQVLDFVSVVSDELKIIHDNNVVRVILEFFTPYLWPKLSETARLRIESKLLQSIREGQWNPSSSKLLNGAFGTWAKSFVKYFAIKDELLSVILEKLWSYETLQGLYVMRYFYSEIPFLVENGETRQRVIKAVSKRIRAKDESVIRFTVNFLVAVQNK